MMYIWNMDEQTPTSAQSKSETIAELDALSRLIASTSGNLAWPVPAEMANAINKRVVELVSQL